MEQSFSNAYNLVISEPNLHIQMEKLSDLNRTLIISTIIEIEKENKRILRDLMQRTERLTTTCMIQSCTKKAAKCHLMQKKKTIIELIHNKKHNHELYRIKLEHIYRYDRSTGRAPKMFITPISINDALTSKIYCSNHDNSIFEEIEKFEPNFLNYRCQLLHSYRGVCAEHREKTNYKQFLQWEADENQKLRNRLYKKLDDSVQKILDKYYFYHNEFGIDRDTTWLDSIIIELKTLKSQIEDELFNGTKTEQFEFKVKILNKQLPIAFNSLIGSEQFYESSYDKPPYFLMQIPHLGKTYSIIGCSKNKKDNWISETMEKWDKISEFEMQVAVSTSVLLRCTNWVISKNFHDNL